MKELIKFLLFFTIIISLQTATAKEKTTIDDQEEESASEENDSTLTDFLIKEIIPAFGGFEHIFLTNKPSFSAQFTQNGLVLENCSLEFKLKQLKPINYQVTEGESDNFAVNMSIGQPRWLFFNASCEENNTSADKNHFNISFTIKDENFKNSYYELTFNAFDKDQLKIKLYSIQMGVTLEEVNQEILVSPHGDVMNFSKELEDYEIEDGLYSLPSSLWKPLNKVTANSQTPEGSIDELRKVKITQIINIDGVAYLTFPTSVNNITEDTDVSAPVKGQIFIPEKEEDDPIPVIDFSFR